MNDRTSTMPRSLALRLRSAGFPQSEHYWDIADTEPYYPSLAELVQECKKFHCLLLKPAIPDLGTMRMPETASDVCTSRNPWIAFSFRNNATDSRYHYGEGKTAEEAVGELFLATNGAALPL